MRIDQEDLDQSCTLETGVICYGCGKCEKEELKMNKVTVRELRQMLFIIDNQDEEITLEGVQKAMQDVIRVKKAHAAICKG